MDKQVEEILELFQKLPFEQKEFIFQQIRPLFKIHPLESKWNINAEIILEAINKSETGLTFRMLRGVIAESAFKVEVLSKLTHWSDVTPTGDLPYDYQLEDHKGKVAVQVKLQRSKALKPMFANEALKRFSSDFFVVETQKTRGGIDGETGEDTRPYRFGEFDILAVSMQPSTNDWSNFMYTVARWLIPNDAKPSNILKFQPVSPKVNEDWTDNFDTCVQWLRSGINKTIQS